MKKEIVKDSPALQLLKIVWNSDLPDSYKRINESMSSAMELACGCLRFDEGDIRFAYEKMRGSYWFGVSSNGKSMGEHFYAAAIEKDNPSAWQAYEHAFGREPFIIDNKRMFTWQTFWYENLYCTVTGWTDNNKVLTAVGYADSSKTGKKKLFKFTREQWLVARKTIKLF